MTLLAHIAIGAAIGAVLGIVHAATLLPSARWLVAGRAAPAIAAQLARLVGLALVLAVLARIGPGVLCGALLGLVVARSVIARRIAARLP